MPKTLNQRFKNVRRHKRAPKGTESTEMVSNRAPLMHLAPRSQFEHSTIISQWVDRGTITTGSSSVLAGYSFRFVELPDYSSYAAAYDQYRFLAVEVCFLPMTQAPLPNGSYQGAYLAVATDYDDAATPGSLLAVYAYGNSSIVPCGESHRRKFKPHMAVAAYGSGAFGQYLNQPATWIDCVSTSVEHYGFKIGTQASSGTYFSSWQIMVRYTIELKSQR